MGCEISLWGRVISCRWGERRCRFLIVHLFLLSQACDVGMYLEIHLVCASECRIEHVAVV